MTPLPLPLRALDLDSIELAEIPAMLAGLAALQTSLVARLMAAPPAALHQVNGARTPAGSGDGDDMLLTAAEVAAKLRRNIKFVYRHAPSWPFSRRLAESRSWVFLKAGLEKWLSRQKA